jgi:hypothetical protein
MKKQKKNKVLIARLNSGKAELVLDAIKKLRDVGNINYLDDIFKVYSSHAAREVKKAISDLISDIKDNKAAPFIVAFLGRIRNSDDLTCYTSCCWQSAIDYSSDIEFFTNLVISGNYQLAIEAFTVVENSLAGLEKKQRDNQVRLLKKSIVSVSEDKKPFIVEAIKTIENY